MAGLRLVGGTDLADALADLTGFSARRIKTLATNARRRVQQSVGAGECDELERIFYPAAEQAIIDAFQRAVAQDQRTVPVQALAGVDELLSAVIDGRLREELSQWSMDEANYFNLLLRAVAQLCCDWYLEDEAARGYATAAGVGELLQGQAEALSLLRKRFAAPSNQNQTEPAVQALEQALSTLGWTWTPWHGHIRTGIDGFVTPTDDAGNVLPLQIPIHLVVVHRLEPVRDWLIGHSIGRDEIEILRAHIPNGYVLIYDQREKRLYFCSASGLGDRFAQSGKSRERLRTQRRNELTSAALKEIRREVVDTYDRVSAVLLAPEAKEPSLRLYSALCSVQHIMFEFMAALAFHDPSNLLSLEARSARDSFDRDEAVERYMSSTVAAMNRYVVSPPVDLLRAIPGASLMDSGMRWILQEIGAFETAVNHSISDQLGTAGLKEIISAAIERSFGSGELIPGTRGVRWGTVQGGHYFLSVAQVALVVERLSIAVRGLVLPSAAQPVAPRPAWVKYRN